MQRQTQTQTQTQTILLNRLSDLSPTHVSFKITTFKDNGSSSSPSSNESNTPTPISEAGLMHCDKVAHVYAAFPIQSVTKVHGPYHYVLARGAFAKVRGLLDPMEFKVYRPHMFDSQKRLILPYIQDAKTRSMLKPKGTMLLVRCKNNSLHLILSNKLPDGSAKGRFEFENATGPKKDSLAKATHHVFEREQRTMKQRVAKLKSCSEPTCVSKLCDSESKYPEALKAIYNWNKKHNPRTANRTWEEVCMDDPSGKSKSKSKSKSITVSAAVKPSPSPPNKRPKQ